jgi:hypothetical protein
VAWWQEAGETDWWTLITRVARIPLVLTIGIQSVVKLNVTLGVAGGATDG